MASNAPVEKQQRQAAGMALEKRTNPTLFQWTGVIHRHHHNHHHHIPFPLRHRCRSIIFQKNFHRSPLHRRKPKYKIWCLLFVFLIFVKTLFLYSLHGICRYNNAYSHTHANAFMYEKLKKMNGNNSNSTKKQHKSQKNQKKNQKTLRMMMMMG